MATNSPGSSWFENIVVGITRGIVSQALDSAAFSSASKILQVAKPGDVLEFHRGLYSHYALYLGQGQVMNIGAEEKNTVKVRISLEKLDKVCGSSSVRVRNHDDIARTHFQASPKPVFDIIRAAKMFQDKEVPYEFDFRNCEYYSTLWRYGKGFSTQAAKPSVTPAASFLGEVMSQTSVKTILDATEAVRENVWYAKYKSLAMTRK